jgi:hypothetical protein
MLGLAAHGLIEQLPQVSQRTPLRAAIDYTEAAKLDEVLMHRNRDPRQPKPAKVRQSIEDFFRETLAKLDTSAPLKDAERAEEVKGAAQASTSTTHEQVQAGAALEPGVYLTERDGARVFSRWDGQEWKVESVVGRIAAGNPIPSAYQTRTVIRKATEQELGA